MVQTKNYYPFGMDMEGFESSDITTPRYPYGYNGKEEVLGGLSDYGARFYDPSIGRFTSVDPLADQFASWSPYNYVFNNPLIFTDPTGMAPEGGNQVEDDYIVNKSGELVDIIENDEPDRILTESGEELFFNDPNVDSEELSNYKVGDQLVQFISDSKLEWIMDYSGAGKNSGGLRENSYGRYDFVYSDIMKSHFKNEYRIEVSGGVRRNRGKFVQVGGFYVFGDKNRFGDKRTSYNIHDAGNFLWGQATKRDGHQLTKLLKGASWNEVLSGRLGGDSHGDQRAIIKGYGFK